MLLYKEAYRTFSLSFLEVEVSINVHKQFGLLMFLTIGIIFYYIEGWMQKGCICFFIYQHLQTYNPFIVTHWFTLTEF